MKKNKIAFLIAEILLCVMAIFFITKIFDQNTLEKKVAVIIPNSGDKNWEALIKGLKDSAKANEIHLIICNTDDIEEVEDDGEPFEEKMERLTNTLANQFKKSRELEEEIRKQLGGIGYKL